VVRVVIVDSKGIRARLVFMLKVIFSLLDLLYDKGKHEDVRHVTKR
jgi:hypothetical protein